MAAGIAHEIRNPLGGIQLYASTLAAEVADRPAALALVQKSPWSQGPQLTRLRYAGIYPEHRTQSPRRKSGRTGNGWAVDLATPALLQHNTDVRLADDLESLPLSVDGKLLGQVLLNLLLNAAEAIGEKHDGKTNFHPLHFPKPDLQQAPLRHDLDPRPVPRIQNQNHRRR